MHSNSASKINSTELRNCTRIEIINNITISVQIIEHDNNSMENKDYKNTLCKGLLLYEICSAIFIA